jgi:hypothetical protein
MFTNHHELEDSEIMDGKLLKPSGDAARFLSITLRRRYVVLSNVRGQLRRARQCSGRFFSRITARI